ncbi:hypothetical protein [Streptomyces sp. B6B3]|uniref:hypothetical protein n=1 Tax=Streptomyces sp. B6B3 TaxID=3153570 RepID=UPI00325D4718
MHRRSWAEGSWRLRLVLVVGLAATIQVLLAPDAARASEVGFAPCEDIPFADAVCDAVSSVNEAVDFASDPLGYVADLFKQAVTHLLTEMVDVLLATTTIDWNDPGFLRTYGMAFAVSSVLTVILWLIAAGKRALQGVPPLQAVTESIGCLLLSVVVSALAPAAVAYATQMFDQAAEAMFAPVASDAGEIAGTVTAAMAVLAVVPGGPIILTFLALGLLTAVAGVWMELIVRDALILSGLVFGVTVFSGLVDRNLWGHVKRWVGVMGAIIASKYVTLTTIALATGMLASDGGDEPSVGQSFATVFTAIALLWLALYLPFQLAKFLPLLGDEVQGMYQARDDFKDRAQNVGGQVGDTFSELKGRLGGGGAEGGGQGGVEGGAEAGAGETAAASTGVGAAALAGKKAVDVTAEQTERAAERGVDAANGDDAARTEAGAESATVPRGDRDAEGASSAPDTTATGPPGGPSSPGTPDTSSAGTAAGSAEAPDSTAGTEQPPLSWPPAAPSHEEPPSLATEKRATPPDPAAPSDEE